MRSEPFIFRYVNTLLLYFFANLLCFQCLLVVRDIKGKFHNKLNDVSAMQVLYL